MTLTPFTELEAVNELLSSIGELPVNHLDEEINIDVANAMRILRRVNREVQSMGWTCNTFDTTLLPDNDNHRIRWNPNFIHIKSDSQKYIKRGEYLYNQTDNTFEFTGQIQLTAIMLEDFEDIPDALRSYITAKAVRQFQGRYLSTEEISQQSQQDVLEAWKKLQEYELEINNFNLLSNSDIQAALSRGI